MSKKYRYRPEIAKQDGVKEIDNDHDGKIDQLEIDGQQEAFNEEKAYVEGGERPKGYELVIEEVVSEGNTVQGGVSGTTDQNTAAGTEDHSNEHPANTEQDANNASGETGQNTQTVHEGTVPSDPKVSTEPQAPAPEAQTGQEGATQGSQPTQPSQPQEPPVAPAGPEYGKEQPPLPKEPEAPTNQTDGPEKPVENHTVEPPVANETGTPADQTQTGQPQGSEKPNQDQSPKPADQETGTPSHGNESGNPSSGSGVVQADLTPITDTAEQIPQEPAPKLSEAESFGQSIKQRIDAYARDMGPNVSQTEASLVRHQVDLYHIFQTVLTVSEYDKFEAGIKALYAGFQENYALCFNYDARFRGIMNIPVSKLKEDQVEVLTSLIDLFCRLASAKSLVDLRGTYNFKTLKDNIYDQFVLSRFLGFVKKVIGDE